MFQKDTKNSVVQKNKNSCASLWTVYDRQYQCVPFQFGKPTETLPPLLICNTIKISNSRYYTLKHSVCDADTQSSPTASVSGAQQ